MAFAQGAVLVLPFPYSDQLAEKRRPALVISRPALEQAHGVLWVAMITSDRGGRRSDDVPIKDIEKAGLPAASLVRPTKLATVEPSRVVRATGALQRSELRAVLAAVQAYL